MSARSIGKPVTTSWASAWLLGVMSLISIFSPLQAAALSLPTAEVKLPLGGTVAETLLAPVTDQTNSLLPVKVTTSDDSLGVEVTPPPTNSDNVDQNPIAPPSPQPIVDAKVNLPIVPSLIKSLAAPLVATASQPATSSARQLVNAAPLPSPQIAEFPVASFDPLPSVHTAAAETENTNLTVRGTTSQVTTQNSNSLAMPSTILGITNFLGRGIPGDVQRLTSTFTGQKAVFMPVFVSIGIFLLMIGLIVGVVYIMDHPKRIIIGNARIGQFAQTHDLTQIAAAGVVIVGAIITISFLVITYF